MATNGNALIDSLARRVRDTTSIGYSRAFLLDILNRVSRCLNAGLRLKIRSVSFTPTAQRVLYQTTEFAADVIKVVSVREGNRDLQDLPPDHLIFQDSEWVRRQGPRPEGFSRIGRDIVAIFPCQMQSPPPLTVQYVAIPTAIVDAATAIEVPQDEYVSVLLDLSEAIVLMSGRVHNAPSAIRAPLERASNALGIEIKLAADAHEGGSS
jgi:hypothetical protein